MHCIYITLIGRVLITSEKTIVQLYFFICQNFTRVKSTSIWNAMTAKFEVSASRANVAALHVTVLSIFEIESSFHVILFTLRVVVSSLYVTVLSKHVMTPSIYVTFLFIYVTETTFRVMGFTLRVIVSSSCVTVLSKHAKEHAFCYDLSVCLTKCSLNMMFRSTCSSRTFKSGGNYDNVRYMYLQPFRLFHSYSCRYI